MTANIKPTTMARYQGVRFGMIPKIRKSMKPPENVIPILTFNICIVMKDRPAKIA
ncbi:hypothetical protein D3C76_1671790 [compost metagenome]